MYPLENFFCPGEYDVVYKSEPTKNYPNGLEEFGKCTISHIKDNNKFNGIRFDYVFQYPNNVVKTNTDYALNDYQFIHTTSTNTVMSGDWVILNNEFSTNIQGYNELLGSIQKINLTFKKCCNKYTLKTYNNKCGKLILYGGGTLTKL